jgi:hypothetical protein
LNGFLVKKGWDITLRSILMTVMLVMVAIVIYNAVVGGPDGTNQQVKNSGGRINLTIQSIDP